MSQKPRPCAVPLVALLALTLMAACGEDTTGGGDPDSTAPDSDVSDDVTADIAQDVGRDLGDAQTDADEDPADDARQDPVEDPGPDDVADVQDTETDPETDAEPADVPGDTVPDTDVEADTTPDADTDPTTDADADENTAADADAEDDTAGDADADDTSPTLPPGGRCDLLVNTGAESGGLEGWTLREGNFLAVQGNAAAGRPNAYAGTWSFAAGDAERSELTQRVDVTPWATLLDAGDQYATLSAAVRNWAGDDEIFLVVRAYDEAGDELSVVTGGPWTNEVWTERTVSFEIPVGTRAIESGLRGFRRRGTDNDAYFDAISFCLGTDGPPPDFQSPPYLMWVTSDAVSVRWETQEATVGTVSLDLPDGSNETWTEPAAVTTHEVRLTGLSPATTYGYRIGSTTGGSSTTWSFRTAPEAGTDTPISFVVWGDNQDGPERFARLTPAMAALDPDFALSTGDCVQNGTRGEYRSQLFRPLTPLARQVPFLVAAGNHERYRDSGAALFEEYLSQPGDEHCFGYSYGDLYIVFIDTELSVNAGSPQATCIQDALTSDEARAATFRAAAFHKPPRIEFWFGGRIAFPDSMSAPQVRETLEPLLESLDVDVVFNGHNHLYAYTPRTPGGITWITTGGAGGMLDANSFLWRVGTWPQITVQVHEHHYLHVTVDGETMVVRAIAEDGRELDRQTITAD